MSVFTSNGGVNRVGFKPRYQPNAYRMSVERRRHIYGPIQPADSQEQVPSWALILAVFLAAWFAAHFIMGN